MKYPKEIGPQSQTEMYALLFSMLGNAYNMLHQYEEDEREREHEQVRADIAEAFTRKGYAEE